MRGRSLFVPILLVLSTIAFAQISDYNLPPGYRVVHNQVIFDLSGKLDNSMEKDIPAEKLRILKNISEAELQNTSAEYQDYVRNGNSFIQSLSSKVKGIYTEVELWYIYAFDKKLKEKLISIK